MNEKTEFNDYFRSRRHFENLVGLSRAELRQRLIMAETELERLKNLNGAGDPTMLNVVRLDVASINAELERRAGIANPRAARARAAFGPYRLTEVGNGQRFADENRDIIKFSHQRWAWLIWKRKFWHWDTHGDAERLAKQTVLGIYDDAATERDPERRQAIARHAVKSDSDGKITAMLSLAQSEPGIPVLPSDLDADPFLFNCANGVIDLRTGKLLPHDPKFFMTKISPVEYYPEASCPEFAKFLTWATCGDAALVQFIQRFFGYALTGDISEHAVLFAVGCGGNGKTTLLELILYVFGDYGAAAAPRLLLDKKSDQHPTELADLHGKRLVVAIEIEAGRRFDAAIFKWLTGGDRIKARHMRENFFEFQPTHKFAIAANHRPRVRDSSDSFWRRMRVVPFDATIEQKKIYRSLPAKLRAEAPGVLAWLVQGCLDWQKNGLGTPERVGTATTKYRDDQNILKPFLDECCVTGKQFKVPVKDLYDAARQYFEANGETVIGKQMFNQMMRERGFVDKPMAANKWFWLEIGLKVKFGS